MFISKTLEAFLCVLLVVVKSKTKAIRILILIATSLTAILILSATLGQDFIHGRSQSLGSFSILHFAGYLFFLLMPVELSFIYCASSYAHIILLIAVALGTALSAQAIDYWIGYSISTKLINKYFGEKKSEKAIRTVRKYGNLTIFVFNLLPLSSPIICLASGMIKYPFKKVFLYSAAGLLIKYSVIGLIVFI
jgi:membrane protein DedA with SNARE-associated domain